MSSDESYKLPNIPFLRLRFQLSSHSNCYLPEYKGSLLRGAFGHALRRTVCVMAPQQACDSCMLRQQCTYARLFETFVQEPAPRFLRGVPTAPRPYVFEPFDRNKNYQSGDLLKFDMVLFGQAVELYPYVIYSVECMAKTGLGKNRHRFSLDNVVWQDETAFAHAGGNGVAAKQTTQANSNGWHALYSGKERKLISQAVPQRRAANPIDNSLNAVTLHFLTPTRLKFRDSLSIDFTFRMLVFKMLRRVLELAHFHLPDAEVDWEFHDLLVAADEVQITGRKLKWHDWQRRSNRQDTSMKMGGFVGGLTLQGELAPFQALLQACEVVHVGKGAVFGNGKVGVEFG